MHLIVLPMSHPPHFSCIYVCVCTYIVNKTFKLCELCFINARRWQLYVCETIRHIIRTIYVASSRKQNTFSIICVCVCVAGRNYMSVSTVHIIRYAYNLSENGAWQACLWCWWRLDTMAVFTGQYAPILWLKLKQCCTADTQTELTLSCRRTAHMWRDK